MAPTPVPLPSGEGSGTHSSAPAWRIPGTGEPGGCSPWLSSSNTGTGHQARGNQCSADLAQMTTWVHSLDKGLKNSCSKFLVVHNDNNKVQSTDLRQLGKTDCWSVSRERVPASYKYEHRMITQTEYDQLPPRQPRSTGWSL